MEKLPLKITAFDTLMMLDKIEPCHLKALKPEEKDAFMDRLYKQLARLDGGMRNDLVEKTMAILDNDFIWGHNHTKVNQAVNEHLRVHGTVPSQTYLAAVCGLNRKTISEHLQAIAQDERKGVENIIRENIMGTVAKAAIRGDLKAAKLYLENTKPAKGSEPTVNNQNNYIQINKTVVNQQVIQQLKPEQLQLIEKIIAGNESEAE